MGMLADRRGRRRGFNGLTVTAAPSVGTSSFKAMRINPSNPAYGALRPGLVSQWKMNGLSGAAEPDTIGGRNFSNNGTVGTTTGKVNTARTFSSGNWLSLATGTPFNLYPMTIAFWLNTGGNNGTLIWHYNRALNGFKINLNGSGVVQHFQYTDGSGSNRFDGAFTTPVNDGTWKHICIVVNASGSTLYINGVSDGTIPWVGTPQAPSHTGYFSVACDTIDNPVMDMSVDVLKVWNRALSSAEAALDYNAGAGIEL